MYHKLPTYSEAPGVTEVDHKQFEENNNDLWDPLNSTKGLWAFNPNFVRIPLGLASKIMMDGDITVTL